MPKFYVRAIDKNGQRIISHSDAAHRDELNALLLKRGWTILSIKPVRWERWRQQQLSRASNRHGVVLISQLAELLKVGVPTTTAIQEIVRLSPEGALTAAWERIHFRVSQGNSLVDALRREPALLAPRYLAAMSVGQSQASLAAALIDIRDELSWRANIERQLRQACTYPIFAITLLLVVTVFLLWFVIPSLKPMLLPIQSELPWVTQKILSISSSVEGTNASATKYTGTGTGTGLSASASAGAGVGVTVAITGSLFVLLILAALSSTAGQQKIEQLWLKSSMARNWVWPFSIAVHARTIQLLLAQNVPLQRALHLSSDAAGILGTQKTWQSVADYAEHSGLLSEGLAKSNSVPELYVSLVKLGEQHGTLESALEMSAGVFQNTVLTRLQRLDTLVGPVLLMVVGGLMACVIMWVMLPVYDAVALQGGRV